MTNRKLDMGKAWTDATGMVGANRDLVSALAGLFLFLPIFVLALALFGSNIDFGPQGAEPNPERVAEQLNAVFRANWWAVLLVIIGQLCAAITLLRLLGDTARPTVREVLAKLPLLLLPALAVQVLTIAVTQLPSILAQQLPDLAEALVGMIWFPVSIYLSIKFSLAIAVIVLGPQRNPIAAMRRSWQITKSNSFRMFGFFAMLAVLFVVIALILLLVMGLMFALLGDTVAFFGNAAFFALLMTVFYALSYALTVAIYRQLAGPSTGAPVEAFE